MGKSVTDFIKTKPDLAEKSKQLSELSIEEITEFAVYDATSRQTRRELLGKKLRKVF